MKCKIYDPSPVEDLRCQSIKWSNRRLACDLISFSKYLHRRDLWILAEKKAQRDQGKEADGGECQLKIKHCIKSGIISMPSETPKSIQAVFSKDTL